MMFEIKLCNGIHKIIQPCKTQAIVGTFVPVLKQMILIIPQN